MLSLEKRFYPLAEIKELMDTKRKETITNNLTKWDYRYEWIPRKGVNIIETPDMGTPEVQLRSLLIRKLDLDVQVNIKAFAAFFFKLMDDELFLTTPWETRAKQLQQEFGIEVSDKTLRNYNSKLVKQNMMIKEDSQYEYWCSFYVSGEKCQEPVNDTDENDVAAMQNWFDKRKEYLQAADEEYSKAIGEEGAINPNRWKLAMNKLWETTKTVYYKVRGWTFNAFADNDIKEIYRLCSLVIADIELAEDEVEEIIEKKIDYDPMNCTAADGSFVF